MTVGDRVTTKHGPGRITEIHVTDQWAFRRPNPVAYIIVRVDGEPYGRILLPDQVQPLQEEQLMFACSTTDIDESAGLATTTEEPAPDEPAPDPEPEDDGDEAELTPWP